MRTSLAASLAASLGLVSLAAAASGQQFTLDPGHLEYRIISDGTVVRPEDVAFQFALQVRYVGGDVRVASLGSTRGRIVSNEPTGSGILARTSVRLAPYGTVDFGPVSRQGMTESHRELFAGGSSNNNADENGGNPNAASAGNPHNGGGEFRWAAGRAGFGNLLAFDNATTGVGRGDANGDGMLISVGLVDENNGAGEDTGLETWGDTAADISRWDTIFLFNYTVTEFTLRDISFDYEPLGSPDNPGVAEDTVHWWDSEHGGFRLSNAATGVYRDDLSSNLIFPPSPGTATAFVLAGVVAARRRRP